MRTIIRFPFWVGMAGAGRRRNPKPNRRSLLFPQPPAFVGTKKIKSSCGLLSHWRLKRVAGAGQDVARSTLLLQHRSGFLLRGGLGLHRSRKMDPEQEAEATPFGRRGRNKREGRVNAAAGLLLHARPHEVPAGSVPPLLQSEGVHNAVRGGEQAGNRASRIPSHPIRDRVEGIFGADRLRLQQHAGPTRAEGGHSVLLGEALHVPRT